LSVGLAFINEWRDLLKACDVPLIGDMILRAGYHPYADGRALTEILVRRHRDQTRPPEIPDITLSDVTTLADEMGIDRQFTPTRRLEI